MRFLAIFNIYVRVLSINMHFLLLLLAMIATNSRLYVPQQLQQLSIADIFSPYFGSCLDNASICDSSILPFSFQAHIDVYLTAAFANAFVFFRVFFYAQRIVRFRLARLRNWRTSLSFTLVYLPQV